jgi:predicted ABC-class ATPase
MKTQVDLINTLRTIDGRGYKGYKQIKGVYNFKTHILFIDQVQSDPFAPPSRVRLRVDLDKAKIPKELFLNEVRKVALEDYYTRKIGRVLYSLEKVSGTGKSGQINIMKCGQEVLKRTSVVINERFIEVRLSVGLPARGRTIMGRHAEKIFVDFMIQIINQGLVFKSKDLDSAKKHVEIVEDQQYLRKIILDEGLVAFVGNDSVLPRESGVSDKPMKNKAISFNSPKTMEYSFNLPNRGNISGMGIKKGITLIVGGGYHGKSTILKALERGVYDHIPRDGREYVVTLDNAFKIRAEDGRFVENVDISPFINNLPSKENTKSFSTLNGSGSTSQAANISEAVEGESKLILLDEDTCATNFMIRDARMQKLVNDKKEPITPFIDIVKPMYEIMGISSILVIGGVGDYFDVADTVIVLDEYKVYDVTEKAKKVANDLPVQRSENKNKKINICTKRIPLLESFEIKSTRDKVKSKGTLSILYGFNEINLQNVEQLVDSSQTVAIGHIIKYIKENYSNKKLTLSEIINNVFNDIDLKGIEVISPFAGAHPGDYSIPRKQEVFAAINRLRTLKIKRD